MNREQKILQILKQSIRRKKDGGTYLDKKRFVEDMRQYIDGVEYRASKWDSRKARKEQ